MPIPPINITDNKTQTAKKKCNPLKITGYAAAGTAVASGIAGVNKKIKLHKLLAYTAGIFTALHIAIAELKHHKQPPVDH